MFFRCAPECINFLRFTSQSDVWAFGVTLWEMFSYGFQPWAALTGQQILEAIDEPNLQVIKYCSLASIILIALLSIEIVHFILLDKIFMLIEQRLRLKTCFHIKFSEFFSVDINLCPCFLDVFNSSVLNLLECFSK